MRNIPILGQGTRTSSHKGPIVGIDLGTTNSLVAIYENGKPKVIPSRTGRNMVPSVVSILEDGSLVVGDAAKARLESHPLETVYSIKRFMGRGVRDLKEIRSLVPFEFNTDEKDIVRICLKGKYYSAPELSAKILGELKSQAESYLGQAVNNAVITVPAYFNDSQRQATKDAGLLAGLDVRRVINEPTAASLAYGLQEKKEGLIAVYDFGGGTFDFSILKLQEGIFQVLATHGDTQLGGDDIDRLIAQTILSELNDPTLTTPENLQILRLASEKLKWDLTEQDRAVLKVELNGREYGFEWNRSRLEDLMKTLIDRTMRSCHEALQDAHLGAMDIDEVVLVGGSTRIPYVRERVQEYFGRAPHCELNPDEVVALGAAVQANILSGGDRSMLLLDVTPLSLGIETYGGVMARIIPRNTTIPTTATELFTTYVDGQTAVDLHVLQGERELVQDNRSLARFQLKGIPPMPAGFPKIAVTFMLDADGILRVEARDERSGQQQFVEVRPSYGLTDAEVEAMLKDSFKHGKEDLEQRLLIEARVEGERVLRAVEKSLSDSADLLLEGEREQIEGAVSLLKQAIANGSREQILDCIHQLDEVSKPFAARQMDAAVQKAIRGRTLEEADRTAASLGKSTEK